MLTDSNISTYITGSSLIALGLVVASHYLYYRWQHVINEVYSFELSARSPLSLLVLAYHHSR